MSHFVYRHGKRIEVEVLNPVANSRQSKARRREADLFVKIPLRWAAAAAKATQTQQAMVWVILQHMAWRANSMTFPFPNGVLERHGVERHTKNRALQKLECRHYHHQAEIGVCAGHHPHRQRNDPMSKATFATVIGCKDGTVIGKDEDGTVVVIGKVRNGTSVHTAVVAKAFIAALLHPHLELSGVRKGAAARLARSLVDAGCM